MALIERWIETLETIAEEFATSTLPLKSKTFSSHIHAMRAVLFKFQTLHSHLKHHLDVYKHFLRQCREAVKANNRQVAIGVVRYLRYSWLPQFQAAAAITSD